jgi:hypothetical protein
MNNIVKYYKAMLGDEYFYTLKDMVEDKTTYKANYSLFQELNLKGKENLYIKIVNRLQLKYFIVYLLIRRDQNAVDTSYPFVKEIEFDAMIDLIKSGKEGINATIEPDILVIKTSNTYNDYKSTEFLQNALKAVINSRMNHTKTTIFATDNNSFPNEVPYTRVDISEFKVNNEQGRAKMSSSDILRNRGLI